MLPTLTCPQCGTALPSAGWEGLCPKCLVHVSLPEVVANADWEARNAEPVAEEQPPSPPPSPSLGRAGRPSLPGEAETGGAVGPSAVRGPKPALKRFSDYELLEEIGRGGMGVVYKARQISLNRLVAVKMIASGELASPEFVQRFRLEAEAAAGLQHPNIVAIHEVGVHEGQHFYSMNYVEGQTLAELALNNPLPPELAADYLKTIAEAVHYAHQRGILHRDLKPSNVLIDALDQPHLTDFGLAKRLSGDSDLTLTGQVLGSPNYMPPEQALGQRQAASIASDIYSLGAILYFLLTGRPPFVAESLTETLQQVLHSEPVSPRLLTPGVPRDLETICLKCLSKEPPRRYASAQELAGDLGRFLKGEAVQARPVGAAGKAWRWCRRNPVIASFAGATAVLLLAVAIGSPIAALRINRESKLAKQNAAESRSRLVRQYVANGNRLVDEGDLLGALPWFAKALKEESDNPARVEIHRLRLGTTLQQCPTLVQAWFQKDIVNDATFSPDGRWVLIASGNGVARVWDAASGEAVSPPLELGAPVNTAVFSPDGQRVATATVAGGTGVWDVKSGRLLLPLLRGGVAAQFSPDGNRLLVVGGTMANLFDANTGEQLGEPIRQEGASWSAFSADSSRVVLISGGIARVWDGKTGQPLTEPISYGAPGHSPDFGDDRPARNAEFSPDGRRLALACGNGTARVCDAATGKDTVIVRHRGIVRRARFSPDGRWLATASYDGTAQVWDATSGAMISPALRHKGPVVDVSFSPDSRLVVTASTDGTARIWDAATGRQIASALQHARAASLASFSSDGERVITLSDDQGVRVWAWRGGEEPYMALQHPTVVQTAAFSPNARHVLTASVDGTAHVKGLAGGSSSNALESQLVAVRRAQFSPDSRRLAVGTTNGEIQVWDLAADQPVSRFPAHRGPINYLEFSAEGDRLATAGSDCLARVWEVVSGRLLAEMRHSESVNYVAFTRDGKQVVTAMLSVPESFQWGQKRTFDPLDRKAITANWGQVQLWNADNGQPSAAPVKLGMFVSLASFSPDRRRVLATCSARGLTEKQCWIVDLLTGQRLGRAFEHDKGVIYGAFSPDGKFVVTTSWDHTARVWDATTGLPVSPPLRHQTYVYYGAFSPDGRLVATASADYTARVWDAVTGESVTPPLKHGAAVNRAFFSPDMRWLLTASANGEVRGWNLPKANRAIDEEVLSVQLLAAHRIDETDAVVPLDADTMGSAWTKLRPENTRERGVLSQSRFARQASRPVAEEDYYAPGEDTEAANWSTGYSAQAASAQRLLTQTSSTNTCAEVVEICSKAIEADPDAQHGGVYYFRSRAYEGIGQYQKAINDVREWLWRIGPVPNKAFLVRQYCLLARCYWNLGETDKADAFLRRAQECCMEDAEACNYLVQCYLTGLPNFCADGKALPYALRAVELSKTNSTYAMSLAEVYSRLGQPQKAADILEKAIQLHPQSGSAAYNNLAWYYVAGPKAIRSPQKALPLALRAVELDKSGQETLNTLGVVYYRSGQFTDALEVFERDSKNPDPLTIACDQLFEAMSYRRLGETAKAESCYDKAVKWLDANTSSLPAQSRQELADFRVEAEEVLGKRKSHTQTANSP